MDFVQVYDNSGNNVFVGRFQNDFSPKNLFSHLKQMTLNYSLGSNPASTMTNLIRECEDVELTRMVGVYRYLYQLRWDSYVLKISVYNNRGVPEFVGTLANLESWVNAKNDPYIGKVLKFNYDGGSKVGERCIRVEKTDSTHISGLDLGEPDLSQAFRNYLRSKMSNITVVNGG